eukprot:TRINITY_DN13244_c0_g1_i1.p1 TRINITY_DN13244_c0_g1~~TRINITY_DN13244_c0_g1_i1.p1  ORF type:complete len:144 (+),score=30.70 TRINITY_DN13244_c0_g1_i1:51-482(+)
MAVGVSSGYHTEVNLQQNMDDEDVLSELPVKVVNDTSSGNEAAPEIIEDSKAPDNEDKRKREVKNDLKTLGIVLPITVGVSFMIAFCLIREYSKRMSYEVASLGNSTIPIDIRISPSIEKTDAREHEQRDHTSCMTCTNNFLS